MNCLMTVTTMKRGWNMAALFFTHYFCLASFSTCAVCGFEVRNFTCKLLFFKFSLTCFKNMASRNGMCSQ